MDSLITIILIGISLSLDAFSLALLYGTIALSKKQIIILSITVGLYHFFMPIIGGLIGNIIDNNLLIPHNYIVFVLFLLLSFEMISSIYDERKTINMNHRGMLSFGLAVSIDSFFSGVGLTLVHVSIIRSAIIFSLLSAMFTYLGLVIGNKISERFGKYSTLFGGLVLLGIALYYLTI